MWRKPGTKTVGLTKKIGIYHAAFSIFAIASMAVGMTLNHFFQEVGQQRNNCLPILERSLPQIRMTFLRDDGRDAQKIVAKLHRENDLLFVCVTSQDGTFVAHSNSNLAGKPTEDIPGGSYALDGKIVEIHYSDRSGKSIREWRVPIEAASFAGEMRIGVPAKSFVGHFLSNEGTLLSLLLPMVAVICGVIFLQRMVRPLAAVDAQLANAARAPLGHPDISTVPLQSATALGWNRLVEVLGEQGRSQDLDLTSVLSDRESEHWESIMNAVPMGIAVTDSGGQLLKSNRSFSAYCNVQAEDELEQSVIDELLQVEELRDLLTESPVRTASDEIQQGDREIRIERSRQLKSKVAEGQFVWTVRDISQQRLSDRMHAQFVDAATHELRTPLSNIKAYAETLALGDDVSVEDQKEFCNIISTEATRLSRFIDDMLDVRSMEVGSLTISRQVVDLSRLLEEAIDKIKPLMEAKSVHFSVHQPAKLPKISIDKDKIAGVLVNLLGNAAKYTPSEGEVELRVSVEDGWFEVAVRDTGVGISPDEIEKVFEKFFRSEDARIRDEIGTGLGLSIAKEVVELHDGTLSVTSQLDQGSTFTMRVPIA